MADRRKFFSPGMEVRIARCGEGGSRLHQAYAERNLVGAVVGRGWGADCWRVKFPPLQPGGKPRIIAFQGRDLYRLAPRRVQAPAPRALRPAAIFHRPAFEGPSPGVLLSMTI